MHAKERKPVTEAFIRWMIRRDMPEVLAIENQTFDFPWSEDDFARYLAQRNVIGMVVEGVGESLLGYMVYELHKTRLHLLSIAVAKYNRRVGVGRSMIDKLMGKLIPSRRERITTEVSESNLDAQLFFKAMGFKCVNIVPEFYQDTGEAAYVFSRRIDE